VTVIAAQNRVASGSRLLSAPRLVALAVDSAAISCAVVLAVHGRALLPWFEDRGPVLWEKTLPVVAVMAVVWILAIAMQRGYAPGVFGAGPDEYRRVVQASILTAAAIGILCYLTKVDLSRGFFIIAFTIGVPALVLARFVLRRTLHAARRRGAFRQPVVIAGRPSQVDEIATVLRRESWLGYDVIGAVVSGSGGGETASGVPILGDVTQVASVAVAAHAGAVFVAGGALAGAEQLHTLAWDLEEHDVEVIVAPDVTDISVGRLRFRPVGGMPLVYIEGPRTVHASRWAKRAFDCVGSALLMVFLSPLLLFAAWRIKAHDGGAVFFSQTRVGRDGQPFRCWKFRTMVSGAEAHETAMQQERGVSPLLFKVKGDPRVTPPGRWLRRYSIDEMPQLYNVLRGDMSLVGPRPQVPREVAVYEDRMHRRLRVRPGMTGLWQVSGRNDLSPTEAMRLDIYYVDNWSMLQDLNILVRTVVAVIRSRGAY
jgi:exopolysaccharide biosynthesis polyprenyl glycosylphosphotransferase